MTTNKTRWRVANTSNHQGLIVDEETGANIAVAYDKANAPLLAAAPDLLAACQAIMKTEEDWRIMAGDFSEVIKARNQCKAAIQRATEGQT